MTTRNPDQRHGFTVLEALVVLAVVGACAATLFAITTTHVIPNRQRAACQANMREIGLAIKQYIRDNGDRFPPVKSGGATYGWADALRPHLKNADAFQCPTDGTWPTAADGPASPRYIDYFYNSNLSGESASSLQYIASSVMLGEAIPGDARQASNGLPPLNSSELFSFVNSTGKPIGAAMRHRDGANMAFTDGHVKWMKGADANTSPALRVQMATTSPTFFIK